jgi:hypothetical protein
MRFARLLYAISTGLLQQIPIMGPVLGSILMEQDRTRLEKLLAELIGQLSARRTEPVGADKALVSALHLAQAELSQQRERSISFGSCGDPCCSRKCLPLKMIPPSRLVVRP